METISFARDIRPRANKKRQQKRNRQQDDYHLRNLRGVIANDQRHRNVVINEIRDIVADVEDEPYRDESGYAVKINLHKVSNDVSIEKSHRSSEFRFTIAELQYHFRYYGGQSDKTAGHFEQMIALKDNLGSEFVERVRGFFSENGPLSKAKNFEFRPQQQEMAARVAQALEEEQHLIVEAGTGVGKSLGYLVPSVLFALEQHKKAIVSTHTINLQEQLLHKDIPILKKVLPVEFEAALMKGRQNYLCPRRLERALQSEQELFTGPERSELQRLAEWARTTRDGSLSDLSVEPDPKVWAQVCSEAHVCTQKTCGQDPRCFYQQARKRLLAADVIVLNHTLLFILLGSPDMQEERESGFLFPE